MISNTFLFPKICFKNNILPQAGINYNGVSLKPQLRKDEFIRSAGNVSSISFGSSLNTESVLNNMNSQLMDVSVDEIDKIVDEYPVEDKKLVLSILKKATQFGNLDSLNPIYDSIMIEKSKGYGCFSFTEPRANSLIETFNYLTTKKAFQKDPSEYIDMEFIGYRKKGAFLLDKTILSKLQTNRDLLIQTTRNDYKLFYPEGWDSGITAFNISSVDDMKVRTKKLYKLTKKLQEKGLSQEEAISEALNFETKKALEKIGLDKRLVILKNNNVDFEKEPTSSDIAAQLSSRKFETDKFSKMLKDQGQSKDIALEVLDKDSRLISMRELGLMSKKTYSQIRALAKEKNIQEDEIFYLIPIINKSFGLISQQYQQINNIPESQFILDKDLLKNHSKAKMVVILDDYVGSGDSLKDARNFLRHIYDGELVLAPCIATKTGAKFIDIVVADDDKCTFMPGAILNSYFDSKEFLSKDNKLQYYNLLGKSGWGRVQANIAFPYMSPDNNTGFFAKNIAENYTFNSAGVKKSDEGDSYFFCEPD